MYRAQDDALTPRQRRRKLDFSFLDGIIEADKCLP
jgi:hypothetical protein